MKVAAIELVCNNGQEVEDLCQQLDNQCVQTVEYVVKPGFVVRVAPHFGNYLEPELLVNFNLD